MFRPATRVLARAPVATRAPASVRLISSGPAKRSSWKSYLVRLGLAGGAVYYYNTSSVFAEQPTFSALSYLKQDEQPEETRTLDSITPKIRQERTQQLEDDAGQQGAFNPETGEINWDCPCLGGMAHGPCGEEFRAAFSCFVYSEQEPKGIDCIEKFKYGMQDCFRLHPDVYGAELEDDEPEEADSPAAVEEVSAAIVESLPAAEEDLLVTKAAHDEGMGHETRKTEK
ncbi:hypothetical protein N7470_003067 [Penicillium chermesinum]|nr:hypothetical protein N7470_003067 [Penicillium chermesinum]